MSKGTSAFLICENLLTKEWFRIESISMYGKILI